MKIAPVGTADEMDIDTFAAGSYKFPRYCSKKCRIIGKEKNSHNGSKRVLYELVQGLEDLNIESNDTGAIAST